MGVKLASFYEEWAMLEEQSVKWVTLRTTEAHSCPGSLTYTSFSASRQQMQFIILAWPDVLSHWRD